MSFLFISAQNQTPEIHFTWDKKAYPVYQEPISKLIFTVKNTGEAYKNQLENIIKNTETIKNYSISENTEGFVFEIQMQNIITVEGLKQFFNNLFLTSFYFNGKKVDTEDILTTEEISAKNAEMSQIHFSNQITPESSSIQKADYAVFNAKMKLSSFYNDSYPQYLFNGNVTALKSKIEVLTEKRNILNN
ncbi:MAG: hypothetical protein CVU05_15360 [Bacteroidetes bacterium HGW-Bacteroidetes-21]|nr:MAG: hypothetical protein CVU05_15360 [Bacteroidetes bacterium HGW-Bacteroidetes-21]